MNQLVQVVFCLIVIEVDIFHRGIIHYSQSGEELSRGDDWMKIDKYLADIAPDRQQKILEIIILINEMYPDSEFSMKYRMPTFCNADGWVAIANQKSYISLYTCAAEHLKVFKNKYPEVKTGKGCINIHGRDDFPVSVLASVIKSAMEKRID